MTATNNRRSRPTDAEGQRRDGPRPMHISLRAGERLFLNGAVIRVDRKVTLELLNDATFLLENHVLQVADTTTPMRQLYFAVQAMLMDPQNGEASRRLFETMAAEMTAALKSSVLTDGIEEALAHVASGRPFHALKALRALFAEEAVILGLAPACERPRAVGTTDRTPFARDRLPGGPANDDRGSEADARPAEAPRLPHGPAVPLP